jgi:phage shock protein A
MPNFFRRMFRYSNAYANKKFDEKADPAIQIQQAIDDAQRNHQALTQQAAAVLGNRRQLEMRLGRQLGELEQLQNSARQSLVLADQARAAGDQVKATQYEQAAQSFAGQLVAGESSVEDLKALHDQALQAAEQAKQAVADNEFRLRQSMAERAKLMTQLESAKMQEQMNNTLSTMSELAPKGDTPSLAEVRDKIESRYATALGHSELTGGTVEARMLEVRKATIDSAANSRLEAIRASMRSDSATAIETATASGTPSLEKGAAQDAIEAGSSGVPGVNTAQGQEATPPQQ